MNAQIRVI